MTALKLYASARARALVLARGLRGPGQDLRRGDPTAPREEDRARRRHINGRFGDKASWTDVILANPALFTTTVDLDRFVQAIRPILRAAKGNG